jgi:hypothetical protein
LILLTARLLAAVATTSALTRLIPALLQRLLRLPALTAAAAPLWLAASRRPRRLLPLLLLGLLGLLLLLGCIIISTLAAAGSWHALQGW